MPGDYSLAQCWSNLAAVLQSKGDLAGARGLLDRSMAARRTILGDRHPRVAESRNMLAQLLEASGDAPGALAELDAADALVDEDLEHILRAGSEGQKKDFMAKLAGQTEGTISLQMGAARGVPGAARVALRTVLRRKGKVLDAVASGSAALRRSMGEADRALFDQLSASRQRLAELVLGGPKGGGPAHQAAIEAAEKKVDALEAEVSKRSAAFRAAARPVTLEAVAKAIPRGAALVEIARYRPFNVRWRSGAEAWRPARYVAYLLGPAGDPTAIDLGEAAPIEELAAKLRQALADPAGPDPKPIARDLDDRVLAPVIKALGAGTSTVLLSPDGVLNLLPFGALVDEAGRYRVEATTFTYLTSGRDLLRMAAHLAPRGKAMVIANPSFGEAPARTESTRLAVNMRFSPLPGTEEEGAAIARLLPGARLATGAEASEGALKRAEAPAILHVATHGFFLGDPAGSGERGSDLDGQSAASGGGAAPKGALVPLGLPLLRSGLAFASANRRADGADDGLLTALEAAGLDLWGTELVVLSACETGVGDATSGEGVYGLRRALVMAGAESEVISLWKVDDAATRDLMVGYYRRLVAGGGRTAALREAQLELLASADRRHPFYWAAFIPSGAWGPLTLEAPPPSPAGGSAPPPSPPAVTPGVRGCGCDVAPSPASPQPLLLIALALGFHLRRKHPTRAATETGRKE